jgi:hypothetical protein
MTENDMTPQKANVDLFDPEMIRTFFPNDATMLGIAAFLAGRKNQPSAFAAPLGLQDTIALAQAAAKPRRVLTGHATHKVTDDRLPPPQLGEVQRTILDDVLQGYGHDSFRENHFQTPSIPKPPGTNAGGRSPHRQQALSLIAQQFRVSDCP